MKSAEDLHAFVDLRRLSWEIPLEQQPTILHEQLNEAACRNGGSLSYTLCAIKMILRHRRGDLLQEIMSPENLQKLAEYVSSERHPFITEFLQLLAGHIKVRPCSES